MHGLAMHYETLFQKADARKIYLSPSSLLYGDAAHMAIKKNAATWLAKNLIAYEDVHVTKRTENGPCTDYLITCHEAEKHLLPLPHIPHATPTKLMGILNCTPDSFSDGGQFLDAGAAIARGLQMTADGAEIIDIGGESTRPGAMPVDAGEEIRRVLPIITGLRKQTKAKLSLDTRNAVTMKAGLDAGVDIINDVSALTHDTDALKTVAGSHAQIVLMHMQGNPQTMQTAPSYDRVECDIYDYLENRIAACEAAGISRSRLIADPGIGFGKTVEHNSILLRRAGLFHQLGVPVMVGASRKGFIGTLSGATPDESRLSGSLVAALLAAQQGVQILRVHDVAETRQALQFWNAIHRAY